MYPWRVEGSEVDLVEKYGVGSGLSAGGRREAFGMPCMAYPFFYIFRFLVICAQPVPRG